MRSDVLILIKFLKIFFGFVFLPLLFATHAFGDEWIITKLRGAVFALEDNAWVQLERGSIVSDARVIRTAKNSRVQFRRDQETIDLEPETQIKIFDYSSTKYTVVQHHFGEISVEAERRDVTHFAVQTKFLAAVVKGTKFTVKVDDLGAEVAVNRGQVQVRDTERNELVDVDPGQSAGAGRDQQLQISGSGQFSPIKKYRGTALTAEVVTLAVVKDPKRNKAARLKDETAENAKNAVGEQAASDTQNGNSSSNGNGNSSGNGNGNSSSNGNGNSSSNGNGNSSSNGNGNSSSNGNGNSSSNGNGNSGNNGNGNS